ncbi:MAG: D-aminoacyl-tRNA deacylase [Desulfobacterales bacterium]|jgi:D-tyrosyl-tRNA(Tyr) deacylase|nr:D-aminoacyl-tRNA deacylase [Desulfobacteraceae bacterium]MDY0312185.1 D-aminoacyl-tRNA deacylase [Desulfobacterales bacterium]
MRVVIQRVTQASVSVDGIVVGAIGPGLMALLGVADGDTTADSRYLAEKTVHLRIFEDEAGKMNRSLLDTGGALLAVSQFTLLADCSRGRRPSFIHAAAPEQAQALYRDFVATVKNLGVPVATGRFQTFMQVALVNNGPVTIVIDSRSQGEVRP